MSNHANRWMRWCGAQDWRILGDGTFSVPNRVVWIVCALFFLLIVSIAHRDVVLLGHWGRIWTIEVELGESVPAVTKSVVGPVELTVFWAKLLSHQFLPPAGPAVAEATRGATCLGGLPMDTGTAKE